MTLKQCLLLRQLEGLDSSSSPYVSFVQHVIPAVLNRHSDAPGDQNTLSCADSQVQSKRRCIVYSPIVLVLTDITNNIPGGVLRCDSRCPTHKKLQVFYKPISAPTIMHPELSTVATYTQKETLGPAPRGDVCKKPVLHNAPECYLNSVIAVHMQGLISLYVPIGLGRPICCNELHLTRIKG